eukprot:2868983-Pleurochrysis_carterae.AAC.2
MPRAPPRRSTGALRAQTSQACSHALMHEFERSPSVFVATRTYAPVTASCIILLQMHCHMICCVLPNPVVLSVACFATRQDRSSNCISSRNDRGQARWQHKD